MKNLRKNGGFSLVELLTVIAIIAILAAIIFPVMARVKDEAKKTQCMTNLHDIGIGLSQYYLDNRKYPEYLGAKPDWDATSGSIIPMERRNVAGKSTEGLYPEYVKMVKGVHCPLSGTSKTIGLFSVAGKFFYAYDSYDAYWDTPVDVGEQAISAGELRYMRQWAVARTAAEGTPSVDQLTPYDGASPTDPTLLDYDYKRQMIFRNPPKDTVVTWCSYHQKGTIKNPEVKALIPILYLDGHCDKMPLGVIQGNGTTSGCRWRVHPQN